MEKYFKPERLALDPNEPHADRHWTHWKKTFDNFLTEISAEDADKLKLLHNFVTFSVFEFISDSTSYTDALKVLDNLYIKPTNEVYARHQLATRKQEVGETIDQYMRNLKKMSKNCNFKPVTADEYRNEYTRDAFIRGLLSPTIRQRLLESETLSLDEAFNKSVTLESAEAQACSYNVGTCNSVSTSNIQTSDLPNLESVHQIAGLLKDMCFFCGRPRHPRSKCPAKEDTCNSCGKVGHWSMVCKSSKRSSQPSHTPRPTNSQAKSDKFVNSASVTNKSDNSGTVLATVIAASQPCLSKSTISVMLNGTSFQALIDTGSSDSFISLRVAEILHLDRYPTTHEIAMASTHHTSSTQGHCLVDLTLGKHQYSKVKLLILQDLCADVVVGHDILGQHSSLMLRFGGQRPPLNVCNLLCAKVLPPALFGNLAPDTKPIAIRSRRYSEDHCKFIRSEVERLISEGIIEPSRSPWRAQVVVVNQGSKKRLVVDYSQTINKFTQLDAYPLPNIESFVGKVAQYNVFSAIDLKSAYHQLPIREEDRPYTAFEADGKLFQYTRVPFGVTNGVACFQRTLDQLIESEKLQDTFAYLDDITICGRNQVEHDHNLKKFMEVAKKYNLTLNMDKCKFSLTQIPVLGYIVEKMSMRPDPDRLKSLLEFPVPHDSASLKRALGMFSYYAKWIPKFSEKIHFFTDTLSFPLNSNAVAAFDQMKTEIANSCISAVDESIPFTVETDASDFAIAATLSQSGRPVAFYSRTLSKCEQRLPAIEKEALAIFDSLQKWRHYLIGRRFRLVTDQKSVSYMFNQEHNGKIKNAKILKWRLELAPFSYDIIYRSGQYNAAADAFSRVSSSLTSKDRDSLLQIHNNIGHPGVTRMFHLVRSRNLPYLLDDVKQVTASCPVCAEMKPRFYQKPNASLIHATAPFERLNVDFKGPIPSATRNKYFLTVVDEFSRFPFAVPCTDTSASSVIKALSLIFSIFGMPAFIHTDQGSGFMSKELKDYLHSQGIATSRSTPYNPQGNSQVERYNGTIWRTISLILRSKGLKTEQWETVIPEALHSIRSLLCTTTNATPHERMFKHSRRSFYGTSRPQWLMNPGPVLVRRNVRQNKYEPMVEQAMLIEANPEYARIKYADGKESLVSVRHLAAPPETVVTEDFGHYVSPNNPDQNLSSDNARQNSQQPLQSEAFPTPTADVTVLEDPTLGSPAPQSPGTTHPTPDVRRTARARQPPSYLRDYVS